MSLCASCSPSSRAPYTRSWHGERDVPRAQTAACMPAFSSRHMRLLFELVFHAGGWHSCVRKPRTRENHRRCCRISPLFGVSTQHALDFYVTRKYTDISSLTLKMTWQTCVVPSTASFISLMRQSCCPPFVECACSPIRSVHQLEVIFCVECTAAGSGPSVDHGLSLW